ERPFSRVGASGGPLDPDQQTGPLSSPPDDFQRPGFRGVEHGLSRRHYRRAHDPQRGIVTLRRDRRLPLEELAPYLLEVPGAPAPLDWQAVFGNAGPVEIEVGFGKGLFLVTAAQACLGVNFVGIEIARKYQLFTATRLAKRGLRNVRLVKAD